MRVITRLLGIASALAMAPAAQALVFVYDAPLNGPAEAPPNASPGTGIGRVTIDDVLNTMRVEIMFQNLLGNTIAAHIHAPTAVAGTGIAGVATQVPSFVGFPLGVTSGSYDNSFSLLADATYNPAFLTANGSAAGAGAALIQAANDGKAYLNIHSNLFPGGEIRGFLTAVPEPATWATMIAGFGMVGWALRRRRANEAVA